MDIKQLNVIHNYKQKKEEEIIIYRIVLTFMFLFIILLIAKLHETESLFSGFENQKVDLECGQ
jgi:EamA domain-containing membrane protein RarD